MIRRFIPIFGTISVLCFALAALGHWVLDWSPSAVQTWLLIGTGYLLITMLIRLMPRWWREQVNEEATSKASRNYQRVAVPAMAVYVVLLFTSLALLRQGIESTGLRAAASLLPVLPMLWFMRGFLRYLRGVDEFQKQIELEGISVAAMLVSMLYFGGGFLQLAKVIDIPGGAAMIWVLPLMCLGYAAGKFNAMRRFR